MSFGSLLSLLRVLLTVYYYQCWCKYKWVIKKKRLKTLIMTHNTHFYCKLCFFERKLTSMQLSMESKMWRTVNITNLLHSAVWHMYFIHILYLIICIFLSLWSFVGCYLNVNFIHGIVSQSLKKGKYYWYSCTMVNAIKVT